MSDAPKPVHLEYADPQTNRFRLPLDSAAKKSLISGLLFWATPIPAVIAVVTGIVGIDRTNRGGVRGRWQARIGLGLGLLGIFFWLALPFVVMRVRAIAREIDVQLDLRQLGQAILLYQNDNHGAIPETLEALLKNAPGEQLETILANTSLGDTPAVGATPQEVIANFQSGKHTSFVYLKPDPYHTQVYSPSMPDYPIAFVAYSSFGSTVVSMLYYDGHVETHGRQEGFQIIQRRLDDIAQARATTQPK